jgi:hypothetical protein
MFTLGRVIMIRRLVTGSRMQPAHCPESNSMFPASYLFSSVAELENEGIAVPRELKLPNQVVAAIVRFARTTTCYGNLERSCPIVVGETESQRRTIGGQKILVAHFFEAVENCQEIRRIRSDSTIRFMAQSYLGHHARLTSSRLWWSFPADEPDELVLKRASQDRLHFDMNDWKSIKFFFYLTDVGSGDGPHVYVRGSHRRKRLRDQLTLFVGKEKDGLEQFYGKSAVTRIHGPAGMGFVEDPFGFHMGTVSTRRARLMLEVEFGLSRPTPRRFFGTLPLTTRSGPGSSNL